MSIRNSAARSLCITSYLLLFSLLFPSSGVFAQGNSASAAEGKTPKARYLVEVDLAKIGEFASGAAGALGLSPDDLIPIASSFTIREIFSRDAKVEPVSANTFIVTVEAPDRNVSAEALVARKAEFARFITKADNCGTGSSCLPDSILLGHPHSADEVIVEFHENMAPEPSSFLAEPRLRALGLKFKENLARHAGARSETAMVFKTKRHGLRRAVAALERDPRVKNAQPNYEYHGSIVVPNDASFSQLYGLHNTGQNSGTNDADVDAPEAWSLSTGSSSVIVGVIDTGIAYNHPDLAANIWTNPGETAGDGIDNDGNGYVDDLHGINAITNSGNPLDDHGHGTHVAGTIGAVGNNGIGVAGVNWNVKMIGCKFLSASGSGNTANAIKCFKYFNHLKRVLGINVIVTNNSWGGGPYDQALQNAIAGIDQPGMEPILHVAAAGNNGGNNDLSPHYPSSYALDNIISVAATDRNDVYASFSNYGSTSVDIAAPGASILSTVPTGSCAHCASGGLKVLSGTSMAAPHVAGAAALIQAGSPVPLTALQLKEKIFNNGDPIGSNNAGKSTVTNRRLNLYQSLNDVPDTTPPGRISDLSVSVAGGTSVTLAWTATGNDGAAGTASGYDIRYSDAPITEENWASATTVLSEPSPRPSGSPETFTVTGLQYNKTYYFALKAVDGGGNQSPVSNSAAGTTTGLPTDFFDDMENGTGKWTVSGATSLWHLSSRKANSPGHAFYYGLGTAGYKTGGPNAGYITMIEPISLLGRTSAFLTFAEWSAVETNPAFDRTRVQASSDGNTWTTVFESHGTSSAWMQRSVDLSSYVGNQLYVRFYFDTIDSSFNSFEGWYVDDVAILVDVPIPPTPTFTPTPTRTFTPTPTRTFTPTPTRTFTPTPTRTFTPTPTYTQGPPPTAYCPDASKNASMEYIARVQVGGFGNQSTSSTYSNFTAKTVPFDIGVPSPLSLVAGPSTMLYKENWRVFIDLDRDFLFEEGELLFSGTSTGSTPLTGSLTIPSTATPGETRMRVVMAWGVIPPSCGSFSYGEVEDYTAQLIAVPTPTPTPTPTSCGYRRCD